MESDPGLMGLLCFAGGIAGLGCVLLCLGWHHYRNDRHPHPISKWGGMVLLLAWASTAQAVEIGRGTVERVIETVVLSDCSWTETVEQVTTVTSRDVVPVAWIGAVPSQGTGYTGGQPGRFVHCPEDCDPTLVLGDAALTRVEDVGGSYSDSADSTSFTFYRVIDQCHTCQVVTPESGTLAFLLLGIGLVICAQLVRPRIVTIAVPRDMQTGRKHV